MRLNMPDWHLHTLPHQSCHVPVYARASNGVCLHSKVVVSSTSFTTTCNTGVLSRRESPLFLPKESVAAAMGFGPVGWRECCLPRPVPIACVGCGACDIELLQAIAKQLSAVFQRQV